MKSWQKSAGYNQISRRQCYFDGERQLKFFQIYTKANCKLECLTNMTLRYCRCSAFFMPSKLSGIENRISKLVYLIQNFRRKWNKNLQLQAASLLFDLAYKALVNELRVKMSCDLASIESQVIFNCLSRCNEITYDFDTAYLDYNSKDEEK